MGRVPPLESGCAPDVLKEARGGKEEGKEGTLPGPAWPAMFVEILILPPALQSNLHRHITLGESPSPVFPSERGAWIILCSRAPRSRSCWRGLRQPPRYAARRLRNQRAHFSRARCSWCPRCQPLPQRSLPAVFRAWTLLPAAGSGGSSTQAKLPIAALPCRSSGL